MDFIAPELSTAYIVIALLFAAGGAVLLAFGISHIFRKKNNLDVTFVFIAVVLSIFLIGGPTLMLVGGAESSTGALERQREAVRAEIQESYGLELTEAEMAKLKYPEAEPESNFEAFGSIDKVTKAGDEKLLERKLYLVWDEDSFGIFQSENGQDFVPLEDQN